RCVLGDDCQLAAWQVAAWSQLGHLAVCPFQKGCLRSAWVHLELQSKTASRVCKMFGDIVADHVPQRVGIPPIAAQKCLLPPRTRVARRLRAHPSGLATLVAEQSVNEKPRIQRCTLLRE